MAENNWDLQAVVRGYVGLKPPPHSPSSSSSSLSYSNPTSYNGICDHFNPILTPSLYHQKQTNLLHIPTHSKNKLRKKQQKTVHHVPAIDLCDDVWAWRKYGQKPIKGALFPRGYYKCSTSKACIGRKQVERSQINLNMFIITYRGEHNHPPPQHRRPPTRMLLSKQSIFP